MADSGVASGVNPRRCPRNGPFLTHFAATNPHSSHRPSLPPPARQRSSSRPRRPPPWPPPSPPRLPRLCSGALRPAAWRPCPAWSRTARSSTRPALSGEIFFFESRRCGRSRTRLVWTGFWPVSGAGWHWRSSTHGRRSLLEKRERISVGERGALFWGSLELSTLNLSFFLVPSRPPHTHTLLSLLPLSLLPLNTQR